MIDYKDSELSPEQRLDLYWQMYFCVEGLSQMEMDELDVKSYNYHHFDNGTDGWLPCGFCDILELLKESESTDMELCEMEEFVRFRSGSGYWWPACEWEVRKTILLSIIIDLSTFIEYTIDTGKGRFRVIVEGLRTRRPLR